MKKILLVISAFLLGIGVQASGPKPDLKYGPWPLSTLKIKPPTHIKPLLSKLALKEDIVSFIFRSFVRAKAILY